LEQLEKWLHEFEQQCEEKDLTNLDQTDYTALLEETEFR